MSEKPLNSNEQLSAFLDGELPADEAAALEGRLAADPALRQELEELAEVKRLVAGLPRVQAPVGLTVGLREQLERQSLLVDPHAETTHVRSRLRVLRGLAAAAMLAVSATLAVVLYNHVNPPARPVPAVVQNEPRSDQPSPALSPMDKLARGYEYAAEDSDSYNDINPATDRAAAGESKRADDAVSAGSGTLVVAEPNEAAEPLVVTLYARDEQARRQIAQEVGKLAAPRDTDGIASTTDGTLTYVTPHQARRLKALADSSAAGWRRGDTGAVAELESGSDYRKQLALADAADALREQDGREDGRGGKFAQGSAGAPANQGGRREVVGDTADKDRLPADDGRLGRQAEKVQQAGQAGQTPPAGAKPGFGDELQKKKESPARFDAGNRDGDGGEDISGDRTGQDGPAASGQATNGRGGSVAEGLSSRSGVTAGEGRIDANKPAEPGPRIATPSAASTPPASSVPPAASTPPASPGRPAGPTQGGGQGLSTLDEGARTLPPASTDTSVEGPAMLDKVSGDVAQRDGQRRQRDEDVSKERFAPAARPQPAVAPASPAPAAEQSAAPGGSAGVEPAGAVHAGRNGMPSAPEPREVTPTPLPLPGERVSRAVRQSGTDRHIDAEIAPAVRPAPPLWQKEDGPDGMAFSVGSGASTTQPAHSPFDEAAGESVGDTKAGVVVVSPPQDLPDVGAVVTNGGAVSGSAGELRKGAALEWVSAVAPATQPDVPLAEQVRAIVADGPATRPDDRALEPLVPVVIEVRVAEPPPGCCPDAGRLLETDRPATQPAR